MFKLGKPIGPFIINSKHAFLETEELLIEMNFDLGDVCIMILMGSLQRKEKA